MATAGQTSRQPQDIRCLKDLVGQLHQEQVGDPEFVPVDRIEAFSTREVIVRVLGNRDVQHPEHPAENKDVQHLEQLAEQVLHHQAKRIFLVVATCDRVKWLDEWLDDWLADWPKPYHSKPFRPGQFCVKPSGRGPFRDRHLPVKVVKDGTLRALRSMGQEQPRSWLTRDWEDFNAMTCFETNQRSFLAPVFTKDVFHYELPQGVPLPFITMKKTDLRGWFSTVYEAELHWAHQKVIIPKASSSDIFWSTRQKPKQPFKVAVKEMNSPEDEWFMREMKVLEVIRDIQHKHLIRPIASYKRGPNSRGCFLFPWAERGNLKNFWARKENRKGVVKLQDGRAYDLMIWTLSQMLGLCSALAKMHEPRPRHDTNEMAHCRHGDIKPENILVFSEGKTDVLCIADIGLGKYHVKATDARKAGKIYTETTTGATRYLPPEFSSSKQIPRIHDVWSLGCLFLEFIIWAAWGNDGLDKFIQLNIVEFWQRRNDIPQIHEDVEQWIQQMRLVFGNSKKTAIGDLLDMVYSRMLVIEASRKESEEIHAELKKIVKEARSDEEYCLSEALGSRIRQSKPPSLRPGSQNMAGEEELNQLEDKWETHTDNNFARGLCSLPRDGDDSSSVHGWLGKSPSSPETVLCTACLTVDLRQADLHIDRKVQGLIDSSDRCGLCRLIRQSLDEMNLLKSASTVSLRRNGPTLETMPGKRAVLSIYADPASENVDDRLFQIGVPNLPTAGSPEQFILFKEWLSLCKTHKHVTKTNDTRVDDRPTRVIDVGSSPFRLLDGKDMVSSEYIALSHCWGDKPEYHVGCTLRSNRARRYEKIECDELPRNFRDAIKITRGLGLQYLWIDSICIIQKDAEDWSRESMRMEQVYSNAKCVLAASSSTSSIEGFLERPITSRPFITLRSGSGDVVYVCKNVDNFRGDVDEAILNTRGWTLQERALARRTIHFTKNQAYFECSNGIQCESLTRLTNGRSSMLGDSDFPASVVSRYKDGRVVLVQTLYHQYSKREFSQDVDRPIAISGLEKRLTSAFTTRGGYGVFQNFLERTLLWKRDDGTHSLEPITFPPARNVPTWSWMAYDGVISYVQADFNKVDWTREYSSPFDSGSGASGKWHWEADGTNRPPILGLSRVRELDLDRDTNKLLRRIKFDTPVPEQRPQDLRCVVIGKAKPEDPMGPFNLNCYVLVVKASSDKNLRGVYLRVGAGVLMESEIIWDRYEAGNLH